MSLLNPASDRLFNQSSIFLLKWHQKQNKLVPKIHLLKLLATISSFKTALVSAIVMFPRVLPEGTNVECSQSSSLLITILPRGVIPSLIPTPHNDFPGGLSMSLSVVNSYLGGPETPHHPTLRDYDMFYPKVASVFVLCVNYRDSPMAWSLLLWEQWAKEEVKGELEGMVVCVHVCVVGMKLWPLWDTKDVNIKHLKDWSV